MAEFFLSHSHHQADRVYTDCVAHNLTALGNDPWYDSESIRPGEYWRPQILKAVAERDNFVLLLTQNSWSSIWVQMEIFLAVSYAIISGKRKNIYVLKLDNTNIEEDKLGKELEGVQHLDARKLKCDEAANRLNALVRLSESPKLTYAEMVKAYSSDVQTNPDIATSVVTMRQHKSSLPDAPKHLLRGIEQHVNLYNIYRALTGKAKGPTPVFERRQRQNWAFTNDWTDE